MSALHDFRKRGWGNDFSVSSVANGGQTIKLTGWHSGIEVGDRVVLPNGEHVATYEITAINYMRDPKDQFFADAKYAPPAETEDQS